MKKLIIAALALSASSVFAAQVVVMDTEVRLHRETDHKVISKFYVDQQTGQGFVKASVLERRVLNRGRGDRNIQYVEIFSNTEEVPGLMMFEDKLVYQAPEGEVVCGTMKDSRILRIPTLYLSGACKLSNSLVKTRAKTRQLTVTLTTK